MGDPLGIGPEIICKALAGAGLQSAARYRVHGSEVVLRRAAEVAGIAPFWHRAGEADGAASVVVVEDVPFAHMGTSAPQPTREGGEASFRWVEGAIRDAQRSGTDPARANAIVTAPISKASWHLAGHTRWPGHTELLAERLSAPRSGMIFIGPHLCVMLATIHVPLMDVGGLLTIERVLEAIELAHEGCRGTGLPARVPGVLAETTAACKPAPRIAVCGLNPHAGEGGILGHEDDRIIAPAIAAARAKGIDAHGPLPGDTVFNAAARPPFGRGAYDCVVAMYHDQGLIPVKLIDGRKAVNVTVGLPTIRTSPAHGTAFDIAGKNVASEESMRCSIELAIEMATARERSSVRR